MGCGSTKQAVPAGPPEWCSSLAVDPELNVGFSSISEGMKSVSPYHVIRERLGHSVTDAARWCKPLLSGKHVFEVSWPARTRGTRSCIGLGTVAVKLSQQGGISLVGSHSRSWGLDITRRRAINTDNIVGIARCCIPDKFFMYVDMDGGKIGFGEDLIAYGRNATFFGYIINNIRVMEDDPLYVMVSSCKTNESIQVIYKGSATLHGGFDLCESLVPTQVPRPLGDAGDDQTPADKF